jgi:hypothetical protein
VLVDVFLIDKLLRPGGIVILDDFGYPSIQSVCRYFLSNLRYKCIGPQSREKAAWRKPRSVGRMIWRSGLFALARHLQLDLPISNYVALQKLQDDLIGEGPGTTRHWTDHIRF